MAYRLCVATLLLLLLGLAHPLSLPAQAARRHFYVGTITQISSNSLTIHSKTRSANYTFSIVSSTRFLQHGLGIPRTQFRVGSYVTVSYSTGQHGELIAYHISLRR